MRLITSDKQGEWFVRHQEGGEKVEFQVRRIPGGKAVEIEHRRFGVKREIKWKKGTQISEADSERSILVAFDKATYALLDSRNAEVPLDDVPALRGVVTPDEDGYVRLDGHWTPEVKEQAFSLLPSLAKWIVERAESLEKEALETEEGKEAS